MTRLFASLLGGRYGKFWKYLLLRHQRPWAPVNGSFKMALNHFFLDIKTGFCIGSPNKNLGRSVEFGFAELTFSMNLDGIIAENRATIIKKWQVAILGTYPKETRKFLKGEKSPFANPVGSIISKDVETLFDELVKGGDTEKIFSSLDKIIRIRAVQDFKPYHAVGFVLQLKNIMRETLGEITPDALHLIQDRIDAAALLAFDVYSQCRQQLYDIRVKEVRSEYGRLLEMANLVKEIPEQQPGI